MREDILACNYKMPPSISSSLRRVIDALLHADCTKRPRMTELVRDYEWVAHESKHLDIACGDLDDLDDDEDDEVTP